MRDEIEQVHRQYRRDLVALPRGAVTVPDPEKALMDFNKLTVKSQEAVAAAQERARRLGNPELYPEHLLLALLDQDLPRTLASVRVATLTSCAPRRRRGSPRSRAWRGRPSSRAVSTALSKVLDRAVDEAKKLEDEYVSTEHLLLALDVVSP